MTRSAAFVAQLLELVTAEGRDELLAHVLGIGVPGLRLEASLLVGQPLLEVAGDGFPVVDLHAGTVSGVDLV